MTDLRQAAQMALEALESGLAFDTQSDVLQNLRTALEQQAEPVAWGVQGITQMFRGEFAELDAKAKARRIGGTCVAYPLYTTPPKRQWQGLTDDEITELDMEISGRTMDECVRAISAKLKERNHD